ncbi:hypothetical protein ACFOOK_26455 [Micromonospora krabiensis]|uniref:Uncharacterized protein n=1 Tax=Micromonospora krabiensis TaxID=307121 RepID=A0A1C3N5N1_9ACTN|nr:hypothetical protein [Micromonospora krabiensis]SBV27890.1 hypothetical protein GA0070620_3421 [Micromonospora krabiensis]
MSLTTEEPAAPEPTDLIRVFLVNEDRVAEFYDLMSNALDAANSGATDPAAELRALWRLVGHIVETFESSKIAKARFK